MPARITPLATGEYYHVYNRGVAKIPIFTSVRDYERFIDTFQYYLRSDPEVRFSLNRDEYISPNRKIVEIVCFCLMPNHFHFLLKQNEDDGIMTYMRKVTNSYAKYFNIKYKRKGPLFEGKFKAVRVESNEQLLHLSRYIHLNPVVGYVIKDLNSYAWSSYSDFLGKFNHRCASEIITDQFSKKNSYEKFVLDHEDYGKKLALIRHQLLEELPGDWI